MLVAETGRVTPAPDALHVEQVGWGVARQVARSIALAVADGRDELPPLLEDVVRLAETPGYVAYAVLEGRRALGVGLVSLPATERGRTDATATYVGDVVVPGSDPSVRAAMVVRALHDAAQAGFARLVVDEAALEPDPTPWEALGFAPTDGAGPDAPESARR